MDKLWTGVLYGINKDLVIMLWMQVWNFLVRLVWVVHGFRPIPMSCGYKSLYHVICSKFNPLMVYAWFVGLGKMMVSGLCWA